MTQSQHRTLSRRVVGEIAVSDKDAVYWDRKLVGFGVRVYPSGKKIYVVQTRAFGRSKRVSIGSHDELSFPKAREIAAEIIARIKKGQPPFLTEPEPDPTVADLAERYMREYVEMHCKPATVSHYRLMLRKHIVPALGELPVKRTRTPTSGLSTPASTARRLRPTGRSRSCRKCSILPTSGDGVLRRRTPARACPVTRVEQHRERFLTREELARLGEAIRAAPAEGLASAHAAAAIRVLVLTGCRRNEILGLRWDDLNFDAGEMRIPR